MKDPNIQSLPGISKDAKRIKDALNSIPDVGVPVVHVCLEDSAEDILLRMREAAQTVRKHVPVVCTGQIDTGYPELNNLLGGGLPFIPLHTGRTVDTSHIDKKVLENMLIISGPSKPIEPFVFDVESRFDASRYEMRSYQREAFLAGYKRGRAFENTLMRVSDDPEDLRYSTLAVERHRVSLNQRLRDMIESLTKVTVIRPHWSYTGAGLYDYENFKQDYMRESDRSTKTGDEQHEHICKVILRDTKKRRKAYRKLLDYIRSEFDEQRDSKADACAGKNGRSGPNFTSVRNTTGRGVFNRY